MRLRKECPHGRYDRHIDEDDWRGEDCPGGEFLTEDALVIERVAGEWPEWFRQTIAEGWHDAFVASNGRLASSIILNTLSDALTVREGAE